AVLAACDAEPRTQAEQDQLWMMQVEDNVRAVLKDGDSAEFSGLFVYRYQGAPIVCGRVNAKNSFGGYGGYQRFIYAGESMPVVFEENMVDGDFPLAWAKFCGR